MSPNPRIHRPSARSYVSSYSSTPTITQSTALWKAMRHREEIDRRERERLAALEGAGPMLRLGLFLAGLSPFAKPKRS